MAILNHKDIYKERLLEQFKNSSLLIGLIDALVEGQLDIEETLEQLLTLRGINTAVGVQLDIIGEILGQPREVVNTLNIPFFAYTGASGDIDGYGTVQDPSLGARYKLLNESTGSLRTLSDTEYRIFLKAKIFKNAGVLTTPELISALTYILDAYVINVTEVGNAVVNLTIAGPVSAETIALVANNEILPRPAGVRYGTIAFSSGDGSLFAFDTYPSGGTFGTITDPTQGGTFTSII